MSIFPEQKSSTAQVSDVSVMEAAALLRQGAGLIDVREPFEFAVGHACGALNIPLGQLAGRVGEIPAVPVLLVICQSGNRSRVACEILAARQASGVRNVAGGTQSWQAAGLPMGS